MKRFFVFLGVFFLVFILSLALLVFYFIKNFDAKRFIEITSKEIEKNYGYSIVTGDVVFDIKSGLAIDNLQILEKTNKILTSEKCTLLYDPIFLIKERKLKILKIYFKKAEISYETITNFFKKSNNTNNSKIGVELSSLSFENSTLNFKNKKININGDINIKDGLRFKIKANSRNTGLEFNGSLNNGRILAKNLNLKEWVEADFPLYIENTSFTFKNENKHFYLKLDNFTGNFGKNSIKIDRQFNMKIYDNFKAYEFENVELTYNNSSFSIKKANYNLKNNSFSIEATKSKFNLNEFFKNFSGNAEGNFLIEKNDKYNFSGNLTLNMVSFQTLSNFNGQIEINENTMYLKGEGLYSDIKFSLEATSDDWNNKNINAKLYIPELNYDKITNIKFTSSDGGNLFNSLNLNLTIDNIKYNKIVLNNLNAKLSILPKKILIDNFNLIALSGKIIGSGKIENNIMDINFNYDKAKLNELSDILFTDKRKIYGTLSMNGEISLKPINLSTLEANLKGKVIYGELENIFIQNQLKDFLYDVPLDHVYFDNIDFDISIKNSRINFNNFDFLSSKIISKINGNYSFSDTSLNLKILLSFSKDYLKELPNVANLIIQGKQRDNWLDLTINIDGSTKKPNFYFIQ
ncbi:MAG: AsmA-like C-terminal region-containing protein [Brevinematia bacterium]